MAVAAAGGGGGDGEKRRGGVHMKYAAVAGDDTVTYVIDALQR